MSYRLFYWALRGRGEQVRLLLNELGEDYEDVHLEHGQEYIQMRRRGPGTLYFGSVPMLQDGDFKLAQGPAIVNYLGRKHGIMPADPQAAADRVDTEPVALDQNDILTAPEFISEPQAIEAQDDSDRPAPAPARTRSAEHDAVG